MKYFSNAITALVVCVGASAFAQDAKAEFPEKSITVMLPFGPGGGTDMLTRSFDIYAKDVFGHNFTIEYRPGGGSAVGTTALAREDADGYTIGGMLHTVADELDTLTPESLLAGYGDRLATTLDAVGIDTAAEKTELDDEWVSAVADGDVDALSLTDAAAILALDESTPDSEAIVLETRDHLLMGMTTAVLDVDAVAAKLDVDLTGQEVQQAIEGRATLTLTELAAIQAVIDGREL